MQMCIVNEEIDEFFVLSISANQSTIISWKDWGVVCNKMICKQTMIILRVRSNAIMILQNNAFFYIHFYRLNLKQ